MATLTISLDNPNMSATINLSAAHLQRIQAAFKTFLEDQGEPSTGQDIFQAWVQRWKNDTINFIRQMEQEAARQTVNPIQLT